MSDDAGRGRLGRPPAHGSAGPVDPTADPATDPGMRLPVPVGEDHAAGPGSARPTTPARPGHQHPGHRPPRPAPAVRRSRSGGLWVGLILSALVLLFLLVFILQNGAPVQISFFAFEGALPVGVALLLAAIAGHPARRHPRQRADPAAAPRRPPRGPPGALTCCASRAARCRSSAGRGVYVCGITPYDTTHLGHAATFVWGDVAARVLRHAGVDVEVCRNVTDVDDVLDAAAARAGSRFDSFAAVQQFRFDRDMAALGVRRPTHEPRAHNFVAQVVALAAALLEAGAAYERGGTVWFRGRASRRAPGLDAATARALAREFGDARRSDARGRDDWADVAVWRAAGPGAGTTEPAWPSPWGDGRPGWHAECAAMALTTFGPALDLHVGGADLRYPHHAYEAAMAEAVTGVTPFARAWLHVGTVQVDGEKMAKSAGNLVLVGDVVERYPPRACCGCCCIDRPWAQPWDFEPGALDRAAARLERLYAAAARGTDGSPSASRAVTAALSANLDVPAALAVAETDGGAAARLALSVLGLS